MLQAIASYPSAAAAVLAADDWSNYMYLILIVLSGLGALANKAIERFGGKKGAGDHPAVDRKSRKYPPLPTKSNRSRSELQPPPQAAAPPIIARTPPAPRPAPKPVARPVARRAPARRQAPTPPPQRRQVRPTSPPKHEHARYKDLPSEVAAHAAHRAAVKKKATKTHRKEASSQAVDRAPLSEITESSHRVRIAQHAIHSLTNPEELRQAVLLREILGPPVALRDEDPWSV